jgi:broad specificity phosphatase PhoE
MKLHSAFQLGLMRTVMKAGAWSLESFAFSRLSGVQTRNSMSSLAAQSPSAVNTESLTEILPPLGETSRRLYLLRHGETDWNSQGKMQGGGFDIELNENGLAQARSVSSELSGIPLGIIASSHLRRARLTADIVQSNHPNAERLVIEEFGEMRFGEFEGQAIRTTAHQSLKDKFHQVSENMLQDASVRWPGGGESTAEVEARAVSAINQLLNMYPKERHLAVVAHGRTNKILLASLIWSDALKYDEVQQGSKYDQAFEYRMKVRAKLTHPSLFPLSPQDTCINVIDLVEGEWKAQSLNFIEHVRSNVIIR